MHTMTHREEILTVFEIEAVDYFRTMDEVIARMERYRDTLREVNAELDKLKGHGVNIHVSSAKRSVTEGESG